MARYCYIDEKNIPPHNPYAFIVKIELFVFPIVIFLFTSMFYPVFSSTKSNELAQSQTVSPTQTPTVTPTPFPTATTTPTPTPSPEPTAVPTKPHSKNSYSIAIYGDSMVDTMGERLEYLEHSLKKLYPSVNFTLYNYGKGSENVEMGLSRWNSRLDYQDRHYPSIVEVRPDIIIIGSFAYNPSVDPPDRDRHWLGLTKLVQQAETLGTKVYMLAEIVPLRSDFGKGPNGVNYDTPTAYTHSGLIVENLQNAVGLSKTLNVPLIDVFDQSIGKPGLTNPSDGIHPSVVGHEFTADIIANTIQL